MGSEPAITHVTLTRGQAGPVELREALDLLHVRSGESFQVSPMNGTLPHGTRFNYSDGTLTMDFRGTA